MKLVNDKKHTNLYRIKWPDGTVSVNTPNPDKKGGHYGFYNKTRAEEIKRYLEQQDELKPGITRELPQMGRLD